MGGPGGAEGATEPRTARWTRPRVASCPRKKQKKFLILHQQVTLDKFHQVAIQNGLGV